ncbi:MAG: hypothetical protein AAGB19_02785 [Cyanobacteria bacterium P01_F01_bin.3]
MQAIQTTTDDNQAALAAIDRGLSRIHPHLWLGNRLRSLRAEAQTMRAGINIAKTTSLAGTVVAGGAGLLLGGTGVALIGGGIGLLGYIATLLADGLDTGRFAPLPFMRTRLGEKLEIAGSADTRELRSQYETMRSRAGIASHESDEELYSNLPAELCSEALMLRKHGALVVRLLNTVEPAQRDLAYLHLCDAYERFGDALTGMTPERLNDGLQGQINGDYQRMRPAEIHEYEPPAYQIPAASTGFGNLPPVPVPPVEQPSLIGTHTRLTAVDVHSNTSPNSELATEALAVLKQYVQQPRNLLVVATGGGGKGITLANLCRFRAEANPSFIAVWCDPKNDPDESGYFDHENIHPFRFSARNLDPDTIAQKLRDLLTYHRELCSKLPPKTPVWLVLDEWYLLLSILKKHAPEVLEEIMHVLRSTISLLDAEHKHVVLVGQSPKLDDVLPGEGGLSANLGTICLFKQNDLKMLEKSAACKIIPHSQATAHRLASAVAQSPRKRAIYFGARLWPTPELTNYSNYDRDRQQHLGKAIPTLKAATVAPRVPIVEYIPDTIQSTSDTVGKLNRAYKATADKPAPQVHPKVERFAEVVTEYFEKHPDKTSVGLGSLISSHAKLKALRAEGKRDVIDRLANLAHQAGLITVNTTEAGLTLSLPGQLTDDLDVDF